MNRRHGHHPATVQTREAPPKPPRVLTRADIQALTLAQARRRRKAARHYQPQPWDDEDRQRVQASPRVGGGN